MKLRLSRRNLIVAGITSVLMASAAWTAEQHVIEFATPTALETGDVLQATIRVDMGPVNVNVTSNPAGLVNQTVSGSSNSVTTTLNTNPNAPGGSYQLIATPVGGYGSYVQMVQASNTFKVEAR